MKQSRSPQKKRKLNYDVMGMLVIAGAVLCFLCWIYLGSRKLEQRLSVYNTKARTLQEEIAQEQERTQEIAALRAYMTTDEYLEEVARERLGLVKDNEIVFEEAR